MPPRLADLEAFCSTVEAGSFTGAARHLAVTPQAISRAVGRLESQLGVRLFRRNTRRVEPTEAARQYHAQVRAALGALDAADATVRGQAEGLVGTVRISVPTTYGHFRFLPSLAAFRRSCPQVGVEVEVDNRNVDFVREGFDLAIRMGELDDAGFIARRLGRFALGVFASPSYLAEHGAPGTPEDLVDHACAVFMMPRTGRPLPWSFRPEPRRWVPDAAVRIRHDPLGLISYAIGGGGLIQFYDFLVEQAVAAGQLVEVLPQWRGHARPFSLIYPQPAGQRPAVRALIDHIVRTAEPDRRAKIERSG
jgi:DNA-binding transcriptional LysR family regulator